MTGRFSKAAFAALTSAALLTFGAGNALAGDTNEMLDTGAVEAAPYLSLTNLHDGKPGFDSSVTLGYGVADFVTLFTTFDAYTETALTDAGFAFNIEALFTPLDTENVDLDLLLDFDLNSSFGSYSITPSFEFNYDSADDQSGFGLYLRMGLPIYSDSDTEEGEEYTAEHHVKSDVALTLTIGGYVSFVEGQQLFLEGGFSAVNLAKNLGKRGVNEGFVSLGYNFMVADTTELITEVKINIPSEDYYGKDNADVYGQLTFGAVFDFIEGKSAK